MNAQAPIAPNPQPAVQYGAAAATIKVADGIWRQVLSHSPDMMLCRVRLEANVHGSLHRHPHAQITYVESGRFRMVIDGRTSELGPGDSCRIAPDLEHSASCLEAGVLLDFFTPARLDFLTQDDPS